MATKIRFLSSSKPDYNYLFNSMMIFTCMNDSEDVISHLIQISGLKLWPEYRRKCKHGQDIFCSFCECFTTSKLWGNYRFLLTFDCFCYFLFVQLYIMESFIDNFELIIIKLGDIGPIFLFLFLFCSFPLWYGWRSCGVLLSVVVVCVTLGSAPMAWIVSVSVFLVFSPWSVNLEGPDEKSILGQLL